MKSYDDTTLFCIAGMQKYKNQFSDPDLKETRSNIQRCFRLNDLSEIDDGFHNISFDMMGLFSFNQLSVKEAIDYWLEFLRLIDLKPDFVTIHPDRDEWKEYYSTEVRYDISNIWTDGSQGGYCTEFYINGIEIGNIVNTNGTSIDVGFGLQRLLYIKGEKPNGNDILINGIKDLILSGFIPGNKNQNYVLRKLLRELYKRNAVFDHPFYYYEMERQSKNNEKYRKLLPKYHNKSAEWWFDTHGIDITLM